MTSSLPPIHRRMSAFEWAQLGLLSLLWGGSFFFHAVILRELPPFTLVFARVLLAASILALLLKLRGVPWPREARIWRAYLVMGALGVAVPFSLIVYGQTQMPSALASILNATAPLFGVFTTHFLTQDERMLPHKLVGVAIGFAGVAAMLGPGALALGSGHLWGEAAGLSAAFIYSLSAVYGRRFRALGVDPLVSAAGQLAMAALLLAPVAIIVDRPWTLPMPGLAATASLLALASLATAFAFFLYFRILGSAGAGNVMLVTFLIPVSAILLGTLVLGESLERRHYVGLALIGLGLAAIDGRLFSAFGRNRR